MGNSLPTRWLIIIVTVLLLAVAALGQMHAGIPPMRINATTAADLGMMLLERADGVSVRAVLDGSMADRAGIRPGDMLLQGNQHPFMSVEEIDKLLQGHTETMLRLHVQRADENYPVQMALQATFH